jgi:hypothetical protein
MCFVLGYDGVLDTDLPSREALWDKYDTEAPARPRRTCEQECSVAAYRTVQDSDVLQPLKTYPVGARPMWVMMIKLAG